MFCKKCGKEISNTEKFCKHCGSKTDNSTILYKNYEDPLIKAIPTLEKIFKYIVLTIIAITLIGLTIVIIAKLLV